MRVGFVWRFWSGGRRICIKNIVRCSHVNHRGASVTGRYRQPRTGPGEQKPSCSLFPRCTGNRQHPGSGRRGPWRVRQEHSHDQNVHL
ncbi:JM76 [macacine gammaherpesvirus 11]|uniref:JM76 n=2 Tax=macacine gammaherpesvirus 11 TaxID=2560570 RepID=G9JMQ4_9GAMA|nr:JM76 [Macaca fuscata rhadinovirus]AAT00053.1 JM76 [Macaca fuscata rhadinovirus]AEW87601.1 JM76 [Macaca fuscata rhadinovirus]AEW87771.1 JM76 [Macaca fuscata rhadinovirus]